MRRHALTAVVLLAACGARSGFDGEAGDSGVEASPPERLPPPDATAPDASPAARPCHLVEAGPAAPSVAIRAPTYSFRHEGLLRLTASGHLVQYGEADGIRTGVWQDPPIYAARYDVSAWPPKEVAGTTQLFHSMHSPANLVELPNGKLLLTFWFDNDGGGPSGIKMRTLDAAMGALDPDRFLVERGTTWTRPVVTAAGDGFVTAYGRSVPRDGGGSLAELRLGTFALDGAPSGALALWTSVSAADTPPKVSVARSGPDVLVALAFGACSGVSPYCEERSIVVFRAVPAGLRREGAVPIADPAATVDGLHLVDDASGHPWLTWWEQQAPADAGTRAGRALLGAPLSPSGTMTGPVERWYSDAEHRLWAPAPGRPSAGPLGLVATAAIARASDAGAATREVHLVHRIDADAPVEDLTFVMPNTNAGVEVVQSASPRALYVGTSAAARPGEERGEIRRYVCREDLP